MAYPISKTALDDRFGVLGTPGSGKTYFVLGAMARLLKGGARAVGIDPLGVMYGLRLMRDGKTPSPFSVVIFGGKHADLPLTENAGALIGETVATMHESCIIDLSELPTKAAERRFMVAFLESIYRATDPDKVEPYHLIVDEADRFAPQKPPKGDEVLLNRMEEIVRRGRARGFIPWLVTQRPAVLNKNVLSMVDSMVIMKLVSSTDRDQIQAWVDTHANPDEWRQTRAKFPALKRGEGVLWMPGHGVFESVTFPENETFDSSAAPKRGQRRATQHLKPLDLGKLKEKLAAVEAETKANDPKALRAELAALKKQMAQAVTQKIVSDPAEVDAARTDGYERGRAHERAHAIDKFTKPMLEMIHETQNALRTMQDTLGKMADLHMGPFEPVDFKKHLKAPVPRAPVARRIEQQTPNLKGASSNLAARTNGHDDLTAPQRRILASLAFWRSICHETPTREQVAAVAGYRPGSGNFNNLIGGLSTLGHTSVSSPGRLTLNTIYAELTQDEARDKLWSVFNGPQKKLVQAALEAPGDLAREELATNAGYTPASGNFNNLAGSLSSMDVLRRPAVGRVELSDWAREVLT